MAFVKMVSETDQFNRILMGVPRLQIGRTDIVITDIPFVDRSVLSRREINICYGDRPKATSSYARPVHFADDVRDAISAAYSRESEGEILLLGTPDLLVRALKYVNVILHIRYFKEGVEGAGRRFTINTDTWNRVRMCNTEEKKEYEYVRAVQGKEADHFDRRS